MRSITNFSLSRMIRIFDCILQVTAIIFVILTAFFFSKVYVLRNYAMLTTMFLGLYQLFHALISTINGRKGVYRPWFVYYWMAVVIDFLLLYIASVIEQSGIIYYCILSTPVIIAIYYCLLCCKITIQKEKNES